MQTLFLVGEERAYMKITLTFILTIALVAFGYMNVVIAWVYEQRNEHISFDKFQNGKDAIKHQCQIARLKGTEQKSCVLQKFEDHELKLIIYDANAQGEFIKAQELCIPSWYQKAKVKFLELIGGGKQFMFVTFEGNTGTGTLQMILMILGWHDDKFVPVLAETVDYHLSERDDIASLKMNYEIKNIRTPKVTFQLKYKFMAEDRNERPFKFNATWADKLTWNEKTYSFYDEDAEHRKFWNVPCFVNKNIANVRLSMRNVDVTRLCDDFFDKTGIMYILNRE